MYQPRPYQAMALRAIAKTRKAGEKRALVVMASGLGKTVVAGFDIRRFLHANPGAKVLYLCHQNDILRQARVELTENILPKKYSHGFMIGDEKDIHGVDVLYASFQTMHRHKTHFRRSEFDYIVVDESHHGPAETYLPTLKYFRPKFMLAITATPERMDLQDITKIYGEAVFSLEIEEAWAEALLTPVDYRVVTDEWQNLKVLQTPVGRLSITQLNKTIFVPKRDEEVIRIIEEKLETIPSPRVMIFSPRVEHCEHLASLMDGAVAIHSRLSPREQAERLAAFRAGEYRAVITVDMFNEGIDVPEANVVVFLRSTASRTIFFQQLGRGLRLSKGKKQVVVLDFVANCDRLVMLEELRRGVNAQLTQLRRIPTESPMIVDTGEFEFDEVARDVLSVIERIRTGYTREGILEALSELAAQLGRTPTIEDVKASPLLPSPTLFYSYFDSYSEAISAIGMQPNIKSYTRTELITALRSFAARLGHPPTQVEVTAGSKRGEVPSTQPYKTEFGGHTQSLEAAGLVVKRRTRYSKESLILLLRNLANDLEHTPTRSELLAARNRGYPSVATYEKYFGSYVNAIEAAGLPRNRPPNPFDKGAALVALHELAIELGHKPTISDIARASAEGKSYCYPTLVKHVGMHSEIMREMNRSRD